MKSTLSILLATLALLIFTIVPALAQEGPDEYESNDTWERADEIDGFSIDGEIGRRGDDDDWFVLNGQEGYYPTIALYYDDYDCDIDLEIYSGSGRNRDLVGTLSSTSSPDIGDFDVDDTCYLHVIAFSGNGSYTIEIDPDGGGGGYSSGDCEGYDEVESNDDYDLADFIDGYEIEGYACEGDVDWFVLDGQEGYYPEISIEYDDDYCDIDVEIFSGSGRDRDSVGSLTSSSSPDWGDFDVDDTCYIKVYSFSGEGDYYIEINPDGGGSNRNNRRDNDDCEGYDEVESNDTMDLADYIDGMVIEGYACEGDDDWFVLDGQEGRRPEITLYYDSDYCDIDLEIWSDDELVGTLSSTSSPDSGEFRVPGDCYIHVYSFDGEGEYTVEITR